MGGYLIGGRLVAGGGLDAGEITVRAIPASSASFELPLNRDGSLDISVALPMVDPITGVSVDLPNILVPGRDFLGWVEKRGDVETIIEAGPIWGDPFNFPAQSRIVASGLWSYFDHRYVLPVLAPGQLPRDVTTKLTGLHLRTIVKRLVQQACSHAGAGLPIDFEPDYAGEHEREYPGSDLKWVGEALDELTNVENGPDITFRPHWGEDRRHVRWTLLTGDPELSQEGHAHYWDVSVPDPHATVTSLDRDATELSSRDFQVGTTFRNLKSNNSIEEGSAGYTAGSNSTGLNVTGIGPRHGAKVLDWRALGPGHAWLNSTQTFDVDPGEPVLCAAYMRSSASIPVVTMVRFKREDGTVIGDVLGAPAPASPSGWVRPFTITEAPADASSFEVFFAGIATAADQVVTVDAITVSKTSELIPYDEEEVEIQAVASNDVLLDAGFPLLESSTSRGSVQRTDTLQAYGDETVARGSEHIETFSIVTRRDKAPFFGEYWPGDRAKLRIGRNPRIPAGTYDIRITGMSFGATGDITVSCAPERIASGYPVQSSPRRWFRDQLRAMSTSINESRRG
ncbi:MAG: hypothetical protein IJO71_09110 [Microbacterium sp.]|uniref:hypothetical protein n=1 Tax=Microbacterium sp. TaxID=51671 RepID=UPI0025FD0B3C|nr:hypothetical protein [Microbacterium sp.]MBQ9917344.1 hypothetical protein [Microbacterium sp.]